MPDKIAVVTGGAGAMGLATAAILGRDHHVVLSDLDEQRLDAAVTDLDRRGVSSEAAPSDISDRPSVDALLARAADAGRVAAVVHAAGVSPHMGSHELVARVNALGTVNVTEAVLAVADDGCCLVNVASIAGHLLPSHEVLTRTYELALSDPAALLGELIRVSSQGPRTTWSSSAYSLSKSFVIWYSRVMAAAFGAKGARILSVSPGSFDTAMGRLENPGAGRLVDLSALKRFGRPNEIAELLAFCVSNKPGYLTGVDILCDGGVHAGLTRNGGVA